MKNYYFTLTQNFIGIGYLILFLLGFFTHNSTFYHIGGIGMLIFMFIIIKGQPRNLFSFLFMCIVGGIVAFFISKWWIGLFWISSIYTAGQLFGIFALINNKKLIIQAFEEDEVRTESLLRYARTGKIDDPDKIGFVEIIFFLVLLIGPYVIYSSYLINSNENDKSISLDKEIEEQIRLMEKSKEYSNQGVRIINSTSTKLISNDEISSYKGLLKKSILEAKKVDTSVLNKIKAGYGFIYHEKYLRAKELELQGYINEDHSSLMKGQILYDEFVDWIDENMINPN